jgi:hypothetical protein
MADKKEKKAKKPDPKKDSYLLGGARATNAGKKANPLSGFKKKPASKKNKK